MTFQDVRIPGVKMTVVQADGQNVQPVEVDEFRMGPAETYDVIVEPKEDRAYTIFAETLDRSGFARGTLAPRPGMSAEIPPQRRRPVRSMADMGMQHMNGMDHGGHPPGNATTSEPETRMQHGMHGDHAGEGLQDRHEMHGRPEIPSSKPVKHGPDDHGTGNQSVPDFTQSRLDDPGIGLGSDGRRVLVYTDLKSVRPYPDQREPERTYGALHVVIRRQKILGYQGAHPLPLRGAAALDFCERYDDGAHDASARHVDASGKQVQGSTSRASIPSLSSRLSGSLLPSPPMRPAPGPSIATCSCTWKQECFA
jgi:hypothetical protein